MCYGFRQATLKFTFYGLVVALWVCAATFIGIGSYVAAENPTTSYSSIFSSDYTNETWETAIYTTICLGAILAGVGFAGFCGVRRQSTFFLFLFSVTLIGLVLVELALVIMAGHFKDDVKVNIRDTMMDQIQFEYVDETANDPVSKDWNSMQQDLKCCGSNYYPDYRVLDSQFYMTENRLVPYTCCRGEEENYDDCILEASRNKTEVDYLFKEGCAWSMFILVEDQMAMLVATLCITGAVQIGAILIACVLRDNYKLDVK